MSVKRRWNSASSLYADSEWSHGPFVAERPGYTINKKAADLFPIFRAPDQIFLDWGAPRRGSPEPCIHTPELVAKDFSLPESLNLNQTPILVGMTSAHRILWAQWLPFGRIEPEELRQGALATLMAQGF